MAAISRQQLIAKMHKVLKAEFKPVVPDVSRPILEQVLFACCLENASYDIAEKVFARLGEGYFDLNEVRVTTVAEIAETLHELPDPSRSSLVLRRVLQAVFESSYSFSLENTRKHTLVRAIKTLESLHGITPFVISFVLSTGLDSHCIPIDRGAASALLVTGIITQQDYDSGKITGLDRAIPKKLGIEFSSLLHQIGAEVVKNIHSPNVRRILLAINADAKDRFPKRGDELPPPNPPPPLPGKQGRRAAEAALAAAEEHRPAGPQAAARPPGKTPLPPPGSGPKRTPDGKPIGKASTGKGPKPFVVKPNIGKPITIKPQISYERDPDPVKPEKSTSKKDKSKKESKAAKSSLPSVSKGEKKKKIESKRHSLQLSKRKPR